MSWEPEHEPKDHVDYNPACRRAPMQDELPDEPELEELEEEETPDLIDLMNRGALRAY